MHLRRIAYDVEVDCHGNDEESSVRPSVTLFYFAHMQACPWTTCFEVTATFVSLSFTWVVSLENATQERFSDVFGSDLLHEVGVPLDPPS